MQYTNHLAQETSPYLLQHAHNPVDWHPWSQETLEKAKSENKPIILSIGYAACHWCHVMAHESFEDKETAKLMNELFINIKVDREERPDLDKIYQNTHHILTQRNGGWPLTVFLTPDDLTPFFSGTYFPRETRHNLPAFKDVLRAMSDLYQKNRQEIYQQNRRLLSILNQPTIKNGNETVQLKNEPLSLALTSLEQHFDTVNGGFGTAPKFPHPLMLEFLLKNKSKLAAFTLEKMAMGGIYDQLAGGFFRYAVDGEWIIPHFEKMLYDNAELIYLYALGERIYQNDFFGKIAHESAEWVLNKMQAPQGGFYGSLDADSEGHEGKYYIWDEFAVSSFLSQEEYIIVSYMYGLNKEPNFEKQWHFYTAEPLKSIAEKIGLSIDEASQILASAKETLLAERDKRTPPHCDTKILTAWNALMIKALITAGDILKVPHFNAAAEKALTFIQHNLWVNKRLSATYNDGKAKYTAYLDDYAFLIDALLTQLQSHWKTEDLQFAIDLADTLVNYFADPQGGFYFTADDHEKLIQRPKLWMDESVPAGNAIAAQVLFKLGYLLGDTRYLSAAEKTLYAAWPMLEKFPAEHCGLLFALQEFLDPSLTIIIRGDDAEVKQWHDYCKQQMNNIVFAITNKEENLPGLLAEHKPQKNVCAYVCQGTKCLTVIESFEKLAAILKAN